MLALEIELYLNSHGNSENSYSGAMASSHGRMMTERVKDCAPDDDGGEVDTSAACASVSLHSTPCIRSPCIRHTRDTSSRIFCF
jgi:hypothetical protein